MRVCLEASGNYSLDVALALAGRKQIELAVINPKAARHFAQALQQRSKNDPVDSAVLLEYAARMPFTALAAAAGAGSAVACHHPATVIAYPRAGDVSLSPARRSGFAEHAPLASCASCAKPLPTCNAAWPASTKAALLLVHRDPVLRRRLQLLDSPKGIGEATALAVLGELVVIGERSARELTKHAGLDVVEFTSGTSVQKKPHISRAGNAYLRKALYMSALTAAHQEPYLRAFYQRLLAAGKQKMQALVAVMRKLLHAIVGMLRHDQPYDGARLCPPIGAAVR